MRGEIASLGMLAAALRHKRTRFGIDSSSADVSRKCFVSRLERPPHHSSTRVGSTVFVVELTKNSHYCFRWGNIS